MIVLGLLLSGLWVARRIVPAQRPTPLSFLPSPGDSGVRDVRVLLASEASRLRVSAPRPLRLLDAPTPLVPTAAGGWTLAAACPQGDGVFLEPDGPCLESVTLACDDSVMSLSLLEGEDWSPPANVPGLLRIALREEGGLQVINEVDVEHYTACVVAREIWPTFETAAYRAQAVAARTFVLFQMQRRSAAAYDVLATQGAQVYRGLRDDEVGRRAESATRDTRGLALTYFDGREDRLFCTYYSAACGGLSQSAALFSGADDVEPLRGGVACDYCRIAPSGVYRWGPVRVGLDDVRRRLSPTYAELAEWERIRSIEIVEKTDAGRAVTLRLWGDNDESLNLSAERFRLLVGGMEIRSADFTLRLERGEAVFENGGGFGHGLGLCQWGMQGLALEGRRAGDILAFYFPGSKLTRVY